MNQPAPRASLVELNRKVSSVSLEFDRQQALLQVVLQQAIQNTSLHPSHQSQSYGAFFEGAWLPGPLSYPWLVVIASLPQILEVLLRTA